MTLKLHFNAASAMMQSLLTTLNNGTAPDDVPIKIMIYDGTRPATPSTAITTQVKLAELHVDGSTAGGTSFYTVTADPDGYTVTLNVTNQVMIEASGAASFFRVLNETGVTIIEGDITDRAGIGELTLPTVNLVLGQFLKPNSFTLTVPYAY